jgi:hypothetical protein
MAAELRWLKDNPAFDQRPASIIEFLGPDYLNILKRMRPAIIKILIDIFGTETNAERIARYEEAIVTGGVGIGKTTIASITNVYMCHWVLCLKNPQEYFGLLDGSRIAFMQMSTSGNQAKEVVFGDVKARIDNSPWFRKYYTYDPSFKNQIRFPKEIWILPGDSSETTFEGYNILGGVLDEADSHKVTQVKDYADQGYTTISGRMTSRFGNRGFLLVIGQKKKPNGFVAKMWSKMKRDPHAYTAHLTIWESMGWQKFLDPVTGERKSFWYDIERYQFTTKDLAAYKGFPPTIIEVPEMYRSQFINSPHKALRDLAGMPPSVELPFFHDPGKLEVARQHWLTWWNKSEGPLNQMNEFAEWFRCVDGLRRAVHVDIAYSAETGDALGLAMGHVPELVQVDDEWKPFIFIDLVMRIKARPGSEVILGDVRKIIYYLRDKLGFRIRLCTTDGFESTDFRQQMRKHHIRTDVVSCDKSKLPYQDLLDAVTEERIAIPPYYVALDWTDPTPVDIVYREISMLQDDGKKIDHPPEGSKDVADSLAGVTHDLMGGKSFHNRGAASSSNVDVETLFGARTSAIRGMPDHPAINPDFSPVHMEPPRWNPPR